jgi:hypothetical protein
MLDLDNHTKTQLKFGGADPALTDDKILHAANTCPERAGL